VADGTAAPIAGTRAVRLARGADGVRAVTVHDGDALSPGHALAGPALIDGSDTTVWVPEGTTARVDALGSLVLQIEADDGRGSEVLA
jgi:N-methylhydantoinase A